MARRTWLFKSEPESYSIDDLVRDGRTPWDGVRNYQARNLLRDDVRVGDAVLFYHSSCTPPAVVGTGTVVRAAYPDPTQFDPKSPYHDAQATKDAPRWFVVDIEPEHVFSDPIPLAELRRMKALEGMMLLQRGSRLSVQPVTAAQWKAITTRGLKTAR